MYYWKKTELILYTMAGRDNILHTSRYKFFYVQYTFRVFLQIGLTYIDSLGVLGPGSFARLRVIHASISCIFLYHPYHKKRDPKKITQVIAQTDRHT